MNPDAIFAIRQALGEWERSQRCVRGHVRIVREDIERLVEQLEAREAVAGYLWEAEQKVIRLEEQLGIAAVALGRIADGRDRLDNHDERIQAQRALLRMREIK